MRQRERRRLEAHLQRLKDKRQQMNGDIEHTARKLREAARHERQQRRLRYGELIELAGLDHLDPAAVLGGLCEVVQLLQAPQACERWQVLGESMLTTQRTWRQHRKNNRESSTHGTRDQATDTRAADASSPDVCDNHEVPHETSLDSSMPEYLGYTDKRHAERGGEPWSMQC